MRIPFSLCPACGRVSIVKYNVTLFNTLFNTFLVTVFNNLFDTLLNTSFHTLLHTLSHTLSNIWQVCGRGSQYIVN